VSVPPAAGSAGRRSVPEVVGQVPGGVFLEVQGVEQGLDVHAATAASRQVGVFVPVRRRTITWVIAQ
jgi:hypothetical protein